MNDEFWKHNKYDATGHDRNGYDSAGYDKEGYDRQHRDKQGYSSDVIKIDLALFIWLVLVILVGAWVIW